MVFTCLIFESVTLLFEKCDSYEALFYGGLKYIVTFVTLFFILYII